MARIAADAGISRCTLYKGPETLRAFEDEVIDRLYVLNAERAREGQRLGLAGKKKGRAASGGGGTDDGAPEEAPPPKKTGKGKKAAATQGKLF